MAGSQQQLDLETKALSLHLLKGEWPLLCLEQESYFAPLNFFFFFFGGVTHQTRYNGIYMMWKVSVKNHLFKERWSIPECPGKIHFILNKQLSLKM